MLADNLVPSKHMAGSKVGYKVDYAGLTFMFMPVQQLAIYLVSSVVVS